MPALRPIVRAPLTSDYNVPRALLALVARGRRVPTRRTQSNALGNAIAGSRARGAARLRGGNFTGGFTP